MHLARIRLTVGVLTLLIPLSLASAQAPTPTTTPPPLAVQPPVAGGIFPDLTGAPVTGGLVQPHNPLQGAHKQPIIGELVAPLVGGVYTGHNSFPWIPGTTYSIYHPTIVFTTPPNSYIDWGKMRHHNVAPVPEIGPVPTELAPTPRPSDRGKPTPPLAPPPTTLPNP